MHRKFFAYKQLPRITLTTATGFRGHVIFFEDLVYMPDIESESDHDLEMILIRLGAMSVTLEEARRILQSIQRDGERARKRRKFRIYPRGI